MKIKNLLVALMLTAFAVAGFAGDIVRFDFNCYGSDADIVPVGKLPNGVTIRKKAPFNNKKIEGRATPLIIDLGKVRKIDLEFTYSGKTGTIVPSLIPWRRKNGEMPTLECARLELNGKRSPKAPLKFSDWVNMGIKIVANDGDTITLKIDFSTPAAAAPRHARTDPHAAQPPLRSPPCSGCGAATSARSRRRGRACGSSACRARTTAPARRPGRCAACRAPSRRSARGRRRSRPPCAAWVPT